MTCPICGKQIVAPVGVADEPCEDCKPPRPLRAFGDPSAPAPWFDRSEEDMGREF